MVYALWDIETNNLVAEYGSLEEALGLVLRGIERNGPQDTETLSPEVENDQGEAQTIAQGRELALLAQRKHSRHHRLAK